MVSGKYPHEGACSMLSPAHGAPVCTNIPAYLERLGVHVKINSPTSTACAMDFRMHSLRAYAAG